MLRKVACAAASKPHVEIRQNGDQFYIKTSTTVRTTEINFQIGQEFNEETVDWAEVQGIQLRGVLSVSLFLEMKIQNTYIYIYYIYIYE